ncbi:MAG: hypothetical protein RL681_710 [Candidatus Parcubacteria bacterium]
MNYFLQSTKKAFGGIVLVHIAFIVFAIIAMALDTDVWEIFFVPAVIPFTWLYAITIEIGVDVTNCRDAFCMPNTLGWTLITIGTLISPALYYFLARALVAQYKNRHPQPQ